MSDKSRQFKSDYFTPESRVGGGQLPKDFGKGQAFRLNELVDENRSNKAPFSFDSENARNFDEDNISKAREGAKEILEDAVNKANEQARAIKSKANDEGYAIGRKEGFVAGEKKAKEVFVPFLSAIQEIIEELSEIRKRMYVKMEREMVEMIVDLTKKIIHFDMAERGESVQDIIRLAVQSILDRETLVIKVHPEDKTYAESYRPELIYLFKDIRNITFEAHPSIPRGGCQVESNFGMVDARLDRLDEQIDKILHMAPPKLSPTYPVEAPEPERPQSQGLPGVPNITPQPAVSSPPDAEKPKARPPTAPKIPEGKLWWKQ
ncbi:MAG: hypothetical protein IIA62_00255 [Nitrospinae bacterium]|nr:hypothetical protein [Nitrospinota bacterium]